MLVVARLERRPGHGDRSRWLSGDRVLPATDEVGAWHRFPSLYAAFRWAAEKYAPFLDGSVHVGPEVVVYTTASGKGCYWVTADGEVGFEGRRRSFLDGCPLIRLRLIQTPYGLRLDVEIYAPPAEPEFLGAALVAHFEIYSPEVSTSAPDRLNEVVG